MLSRESSITSPVSLSWLATVILHAIIPNRHKQNGSWQYEAESFKNKIKNQAMLAKFDSENLLQTYPHIFSEDLHRPKKWSLEPTNQWKYVNQQKTRFFYMKVLKGVVVVVGGGDGRATFVPPTPPPAPPPQNGGMGVWGGGTKTTKQQSLPETLKWDGSVKRVMFSLSSSVKCRTCPGGPTPHRLDKCRCRSRGQSHCKFHC